MIGYLQIHNFRQKIKTLFNHSRKIVSVFLFSFSSPNVKKIRHLCALGWEKVTATKARSGPRSWQVFLHFLSGHHHTNNINHNWIVSGGSKTDNEKGPGVKSPIIMYPHHIAISDYENTLKAPFLKVDIDGN